MRENDFFPECSVSEHIPVFRAAYSDRTACLLAELSRLSYIPFEREEVYYKELKEELKKRGFKLVQTFVSQNVQAFLTEGIVRALIFRGIEGSASQVRRNITNLLRDTPAEKSRTAFRRLYHETADPIKRQVLRLNDLPLYLAGHSTGGALAAMAAQHLPEENLAACYTFGSPRIGKNETDSANKVPVYRIVTTEDILPIFPFRSGYRHSGTLFLASAKGVHQADTLSALWRILSSRLHLIFSSPLQAENYVKVLASESQAQNRRL